MQEKLKEEDNLQPVPKNERCTLDCISKYEYARVIGMRARQIASNSPLYIDDPLEQLKGLSAIDIAEREFKAKRLPFIVRRVLPNGWYEDWPLHELHNKNI
jgi:DNA-directed RNA polymerases I, II, and III subunit RPABC2